MHRNGELSMAISGHKRCLCAAQTAAGLVQLQHMPIGTCSCWQYAGLLSLLRQRVLHPLFIHGVVLKSPYFFGRASNEIGFGAVILFSPAKSALSFLCVVRC